MSREVVLAPGCCCRAWGRLGGGAGGLVVTGEGRPGPQRGHGQGWREIRDNG